MSEARKSDLVDIACEVRDDNPARKAIAVADGSTETQPNGREREKWYWLPRKLVQVNADEGTVTMPERIAYEKGLI